MRAMGMNAQRFAEEKGILMGLAKKATSVILAILISCALCPFMSDVTLNQNRAYGASEQTSPSTEQSTVQAESSNQATATASGTEATPATNAASAASTSTSSSDATSAASATADPSATVVASSAPLAASSLDTESVGTPASTQSVRGTLATVPVSNADEQGGAQGSSSIYVNCQTDPATVVSGTFTFGTSGITMTATVDGEQFTGSPANPEFPCATGKTVEVTFSIPQGANVVVDANAGASTKTLTSTDNTFMFTKTENGGQLGVTINKNVTIELADMAQYNTTYKTTYASISYFYNNTWTDLSQAEEVVVKDPQTSQVTGYQYKLPLANANIKITQPYSATTGKYLTNNGVGWMGQFDAPAGSKDPFLQPYPNEFNGNAGYEIDGYTVGTYHFGFSAPFWSLFWDVKADGAVHETDVLKNGTFLIQNFDTNPAILHAVGPDGKPVSSQAADGTQGYVMIVDNTGTISGTFTPERGYQVLSTNIKDSQGNSVSLTPDVNNACTFTFNVANNLNTAITAAFTKADDTVSVDSTTVGTAELSNADAAITSGNLNLNVDDTTLNTQEETAAVDAVGSGTVAASYDVELQQFWNQGSANAKWTQTLTEITDPATVTMNLDASLQLADGETYQVVREHNGVDTVVDSTYDAATNSLSFSSNQYSTFTLVKTAATDTPNAKATTTSATQKSGTTTPTKTTSTTTTKASTTTAKTSDTPIEGLLAGLAFAALAGAGLAYKRQRDIQ